MSDDDGMFGIKANFGLSGMLMEIDNGGDVRRFIGVDDDGKPVGRWPSDTAQPFMFTHGSHSKNSVPDDYMISAAEFEAKWTEAGVVVDRQQRPSGFWTRLAQLAAAVLTRYRG